MKAFRGTLIALGLLAVVGGAYFVLGPKQTPRANTREEECNRLFSFEKHELMRVDIDRPSAEGDDLAFSEHDDGEWYLEGDGEVVDRSMVNRVKHQIHDLCARADISDPEALEKYGLGALAAKVKLTLRDGKEIRFSVGDPNPSNVSYYIQREGEATIYTVKKSAADFWFSELKNFRERRFAKFDTKDVLRLRVEMRLEGAPTELEFQRAGEEWEMRAPTVMSAQDDEIRRLLGRVQALKARDFEDIPLDQLDARRSEFGLDAPRMRILLEFGGRDPLEILVGGDVPGADPSEPLAYMLVVGDNTVQQARNGMVEDFTRDPQTFRNRKVVRMKAEDVVSVDVVLQADETDDLAGKAGVRYAAEQWLWEDGTPVPGSTPERVARSLSELEVDAFVDDTPEALSAYGLDDPKARAVLTNRDDEERVVLIGDLGEPEIMPEGEERARRYVTIEGSESVYLVDERALRVVNDMVRERNRKAERDSEKGINRERIPTEIVDDPDEEGLQVPPPPPPLQPPR